ncbi:CapA family protein [Streptosporangium fragile]|uniref:CapA family protein n=1 Tax=Streptosporangium fragile TaxID=46186 RepID=A0ABN3WEG6_9ACTN
MTIALAGDTMLGRGVAPQIEQSTDPADFLSSELLGRLAEADFFLLNLECCVSARGSRWEARGKPFHFRAPPQAADLLARLGVGCVTLANNHALDYGYEALTDTLDHLGRAGIGTVGAGPDLDRARRPAVFTVRGTRLGVIGVSDHPRDFAAEPARPGIAYADLSSGTPPWTLDAIRELRPRVDAVLVTPHWGPNMTDRPLPYVRTAAWDFVGAGATVVAGHSAHVFHGVDPPVLYDLGDFIDDYAVDELLRNDLGLLWFVEFGERGPVRLRALPIKLAYARTRAAHGEEWAWIRRRFTQACARMGTAVSVEEGEFVVGLGNHAYAEAMEESPPEG